MSLDDRLSFGESPLGGPPPETEPEQEPGKQGRPNRAFIFIAIAMGGLIVLGILALIGALTFIVPSQRQARVEAITMTIEAATQEAANATPTFTPSPTPVPPTQTAIPTATWTPIPTATATRVVPGGDDAAATPKPTSTRAPSDSWGDTTTPSAGLGAVGTVSIAVGLAGLLFAVRKLRIRQ